MKHDIQCRCRYCRGTRQHREYELALAKKVQRELMEALDERARAVDNPVDD